MTRALLLAVLVACAPKAATPPAPVGDPPATAAPTPPAAALLGPDGTHVAVERTYEGHCAPEGSRGGCVTITLRPDGSYRNFQYDMALEGTYTISDHTVTLAGPEPGMTEQMTLSADGEKLDDIALKR